MNLAATEGKHKDLPKKPSEHDVHHGATSDKAKEAVKPKGIGADEELAKIPVEIIGDNEEKILEYLPEVKGKEMEKDYLERCVIVLYPEYYDQQQATSLCADKYQRTTTITTMKKQNLNSMKSKPMSKFDEKKLEFQVLLANKDLRERGVHLADYPWDECIADQIKQYGDEETAKAVCGKIKAESGGGAQTEKGK